MTTIEELKMPVENWEIIEVKKALKALGYKKGIKFKITRSTFGCVNVKIDGEWNGVYDIKRKTFVC